MKYLVYGAMLLMASVAALSIGVLFATHVMPPTFAVPILAASIAVVTAIAVLFVRRPQSRAYLRTSLCVLYFAVLNLAAQVVWTVRRVGRARHFSIA